MSLDHLRAALDAAGHGQAVLSHRQTLASLGCFETPDEEWPVSNPFVMLPALLCLGPRETVHAHIAQISNTDCTAYCVAPCNVLEPYAR